MRTTSQRYPVGKEKESVDYTFHFLLILHWSAGVPELAPLVFCQCIWLRLS